MNQIFFWRDIYGDFTMFAPYQDIIRRLFQGEHHGLGIEKLRAAANPPIYSIRLNRRDRLLFTSYRDRLCLLDVVYDHQYAKSRFLRSPKKYLDFANLSLDRSIDWFPATPELPRYTEVPSFTALDYYQRQFIELNEAQNDMLSSPIPAIIAGPAGSGKTSTAFILLTQALSKYDGPIAYVSRSQALVRHVQRMWHESYPEDSRTQFFTYTELYHSEDDQPQFFDWYESQPKGGAGSALTGERIWQEFRIRAGFDDDSAYYHLGKRQSLAVEGEREAICAWYSKYQKHLATTVSTELSTCTQDLGFALVVVDEAQDLSFAQLKNLYRGSHGQILFLLGSHQILFDGISRMNFLKDLLFREGLEVPVITLPTTFRCAEYVCNVLNALIHAKIALSGGGSDKYERFIETAPHRMGQGQFELRKTTEIDDLCGDNPDVAIITLEHLKAEAREKFNSTLVFTVAEIKGLEFHSIILWKLLSDDASKAMSRVFDASSASSSLHRPKPGHARPEFLPLCDAWITAASRAQERLIWVDDKTHAIENIYQYLAGYTATATVTAPMTSEWGEIFERLMDSGAHEQAAAVQSKHLPPAPAPDYTEALLSFKTYLETKKRASLAPSLKAYLQADGGDDPSKTLLYFLLNHPEGSALLVTFYQKHQKIFHDTIPMKIWLQRIAPSESMLHCLYHHAKSCCIELMTNLMPKLPQEIFNADHPQSMLPLLASDPAGQEFLQMLYRRYPKLIPNQVSLLGPIMVALLEQASAPDQKELRKKLSSLELKFTLRESKKYAKIAEQALKRNNFWLLERFSKWGIAAQPIFPYKQNLIHLAVVALNLKAVQTLCIPGANLDDQDEQGHSPLLLAVIKKSLPLVQYLCDQGANLELTMNEGVTALMVAAASADLNMVKYLHARGANIHHTCLHQENALFNAAHCSLELVQYLHQQGVKIDQVSAKGQTPMMIAAGHGRLSILRYICDHDPAVDARDHDGATALAIAADFGQLEAVECLFKKGASLDISFAGGKGTPMILASKSGHLPVVKFLCAQGINVNQTTDEGATPVMVAAQHNHLHIVRYLCTIGAEINLKMNNGRTALILAAQKGHLAMVRYLHENGALLNETGHDGVGALFLAAQQNYFDIVTYLCHHGAYTEHKLYNNSTAVFAAAQAGYLNIVKCLCDHGANMHHRAGDNVTLLYLATQNNDLEMVKYLSQYVDLNTVKAVLPDGSTPLLLAAQRGYLSIIEHFCKLGTKWNMTLVDLSSIIRCAHQFDRKAIVKYISSFLTTPSLALSHSGIFKYFEDNKSAATSSPPYP